MSMYTRCPHCETIYRVTTRQLHASSGQVRCGRCRTVFDAFSALSSQLPTLPLPTRRQREPEEAPPAMGADGGPVAPGAVPGGAPATGQDGTSSPATELHADEPEVLTLPEELFDAYPLTARQRRSSTLVSAALAFLLAVQAAWFFPNQLAQHAPGLRRPLLAFCALTGCSMGLPRLPDQLYIEASDLQLLDSEQPNEVVLTATIRNRASVPQEFPLLELTLTDATSQPAARKVFAPRDYLHPEVDSTAGLSAHQELSIRLYLNTGAVQPAGYRLYLFFT